MKKNHFAKSAAYLSLLGLISSCSTFHRSTSSEDFINNRSAHQVYGELQESGVGFNARALMVDGANANGDLAGGVTWGAEKEASSWLILKAMGPSGGQFKTYIANLPDDKREEFLRDFLHHYAKDANGYRTFRDDSGTVIDLARDVKNVDGEAKTLDLAFLKATNFESASLSELDEKFAQLCEQWEGRPMSFIKPSVRAKLWKSQLPGLEGVRFPKNYYDYTPNFGPAEKYVRDAHGTGVGGWEINFRPLGTYGEFEESVMWFRSELKNAGQLFQAPGHQRMVFQRHPNLPEEKLADLYRAIQALIVLDGIKGRTGIEFANYKSVLSDADVASLRTGRGVIRLEGERFGQNTMAVEFRAGTKDIRLARFLQTTLAARIAANDFDGLEDISKYSLYTDTGYSGWGAEDLSNRFGVKKSVAKKAIENLNASGIKASYTVPFWNWTKRGIPFISTAKRALIRDATKAFIEQAAAVSGSEDQMKRELRDLMVGWTKHTNLQNDIRRYIKPKRAVADTADILNFNPPPGRALVANPVDVNQIDLGIEYSGKMPVKLYADFSEDKLQDNKKAWIQTSADLGSEERKALLERVAVDLHKNLGGEGEASLVQSDGHGHGLDIAYEIRDPKNRKWVVEWDGIGRSYSAEGEIIDGSVRSGSVELVTPKFVPTAEDMSAVYKAFDSNNIVPHILTGGGHINIDLAAFDGNPKALARFMTIFHEHRGIISLMFQHYNRLRTSEPLEISNSLAQKLKNFNGSENELKKLLYNEQYFNTRYGRKTRYVQLDLSAYYQDVIPEEFVTEDFDIQSPMDPWRRTFRVDPRIRKAEFRMFNAPRDPVESALQIRLVRAMLSKALNEEGSLSGKVQKVDHLDYLAHPDRALADLKKMCDDLGLEVDDYRPAMGEGLSDTDIAKRSEFFETFQQKIAPFKAQTGWGEAVTPRSAANAISSEGRHWSPGPADELNTMTHEDRIAAARRAQAIRDQIVPNRTLQKSYRRSDSCAAAISSFLR